MTEFPHLNASSWELNSSLCDSKASSDPRRAQLQPWRNFIASAHLVEDYSPPAPLHRMVLAPFTSMERLQTWACFSSLAFAWHCLYRQSLAQNSVILPSCSCGLLCKSTWNVVSAFSLPVEKAMKIFLSRCCCACSTKELTPMQSPQGLFIQGRG